MNTPKDTQTLTKEEALRKVAEVLEEALAEYESLEKMDLELAEDPSRPFPKAEDESEESEDGEDGEENEDEESEEEKKKKKLLADKDGDENEDEMEPKDDEMSDDAMKSEYAAFQKKMEARGLLKKEEPKTNAKIEDVKKSEISVGESLAKAEVETLRKSIDDRFASFEKSISTIQEVVTKIAGQPASPRKGVSGLQPLKKSEEGSVQFSKSQICDKLLELKKSGDRRVNTSLIARIETNCLQKADFDLINSILA